MFLAVLIGGTIIGPVPLQPTITRDLSIIVPPMVTMPIIVPVITALIVTITVIGTKLKK